MGIYALHLGSELVHVTRTAEWRIVPKLLAVEPLTLKSGIAAPRSSVNNCGKLTGDDILVMTYTQSEHVTAVLNVVDDGFITWDDHDVVMSLRGALKHDAPRPNHQQRSSVSLKPHQIAPSGRVTKTEQA